MTARPRRSGQAGMTMIEIMISVALVGIATAFVFSIQIKMSSALHDQQTVSETQQTLRSATELILRDLRMSGYLAQQVAVSNGLTYGPVTVVNGGVNGGPDELIVLYGDATSVATVNRFDGSPPNGSTGYTDTTGAFVRSVTGFAAGNLVLLTHAGVSTTGGGLVVPAGLGCLLSVTGVAPGNIRIDPGPAVWPSWNSPANAHCTSINATAFFNDGLTELTKVVFRRYRIRPGDARGVLEMSPSGGLSPVNDYQPMALGIVDMQIALRVALPSPPAAGFCATDGDVTTTVPIVVHDWFSSNNMAAGAIPAGAKVIEVSLTLLAKTTKEVQGVTIATTPDLFVGNPACNHVGDVAGKTLAGVPTTSMYYGDHVYRTYTATVDLRNAGAQN